MSKTDYAKPADSDLRGRLSPLEYEVTQHEGTEPPFRNRFWDNHEAGLYVDVVSGEPLFTSVDKFDSGTGWPSFTKPVEAEHVVSRTDAAYGMTRTEVRSKGADSHLGHVFDDGPAPSGLRYCINSASLRFIPVDRLEAEGYGAYLPLFGRESKAKEPLAPETKGAAAHVHTNACARPAPGKKAGCAATLEEAVLAGGCFWGMEEILRTIPGVIDTEVGYTGQAEAVRIYFDPKKVTYEDLLEKWFFRMHDPTTKDQQGNDRGPQYRSAIFVTSPEQRTVAEAVKQRVDRSGKWGAPVVTEIAEASAFTPAEEDHQDYLQKHPGGYSCHFLRP